MSTASVVSASWYDRLNLTIRFIETGDTLTDIEIEGYNHKLVSIKKIRDLVAQTDDEIRKKRWNQPTRRIVRLNEKIEDAYNKDNRAISKLLDEGADPNLLFMKAVKANNEKLAIILLNAGADPKGYENRTPLIGRSVGPSDSPLSYAAYSNQIELIKMLLVKKAALNEKGGWGWTPIMRAAMMGHHEIVRLLLAAGADPRIKDDEGLTAFDHARKKKQEKVIEILAPQ